MVNNISHAGAGLAASAAFAAPRQPAERTETPTVTERPVPPSNAIKQQGTEDRVTLGERAVALAAAGGEEQNRTRRQELEQPNNRAAAGAGYYQSVIRALGASSS